MSFTAIIMISFTATILYDPFCCTYLMSFIAARTSRAAFMGENF
jgi:hypothetical protein